MAENECCECETCPRLTTCVETWWEAARRMCVEAKEGEGQ